MEINNPSHNAIRWHQTVQISGALNDNLFKLIALFALFSWHGPDERTRILALVGAVFALPFIGFTSLGGYLADRVSKSKIILRLKQAELIIMGLGIAALATESVPMLFATMLLMSTQSALFGPSKYGLVPEIVAARDITRTNSHLQTLTYLAIIAGVALAPAFTALSGAAYHVAALGCFGISIVGFFAATQLDKALIGGPRESLRSRSGFRESISIIRQDRWLLLAIIGLACFSFFAAFTQLNVIDFGKEHLGLSDEQSGVTLLIIALGIGTGSLLVGRLSRHATEFGAVPLGALGIAMGLFLLGSVGSQSIWATCLFLFLIGVAAGCMTVPLHAFIQQRSPNANLGTIIGISGLLNWIAIFAASPVLYLSDTQTTLASADRFVALSILALGLVYLTVRTIPDFLARLIISLVARCFYTIRHHGIENIPAEGPALIVSNHVSLLDAVFLTSAQPRRIRLIMSRDFYENSGWFTRWICDLARVILIHESENPKKLIHSLKTARQALVDGELVGIFAEGHLSRRNLMLPLKSGFTRIVKGTHAPIIPVSIQGIWGSHTTYSSGLPAIRPWTDRSRIVSVSFGAQLPTQSQPGDIAAAISQLAADQANTAKTSYKNLPAAFLSQARKSPNAPCISDSSGKQLNYSEALTATLLLKKNLLERFEGQAQHIGILLPASVGGALANLAISFTGRIPVNINFRAGSDHIASAVSQAKIRWIVTARAMPLPDGIPASIRVLYVEELLRSVTKRQRLEAYLRARFLPQRFLLNQTTSNSDDTAAILFTSGSTRAPKGVCLSHRNILSNAESFGSVLNAQTEDKVCGTLPFFHSFGFTATLWCPLINGISTTYHNNPLDTRRVGQLVQEERATILLSTPTFLNAYQRRVTSDQFASLRWVFSSAERLSEELADSFEEKYGIRPLQGYGATELSPITTISLPNHTIDGLHEIGSKPGSVGRAIPGVALQIIDPESKTAKQTGERGLIRVKGPNTMQGYLHQPELTANALEDGWYNTGDIGYLDADGFLFITDRIARFAKLGGEMVPLGGVEEALSSAIGVDATHIAVTAIPDTSKGERLIVLVSEPIPETELLRQQLLNLPLPNLWKPDLQAFIHVPEIPLLATGKRDYGRIRNMAEDLVKVPA